MLLLAKGTHTPTPPLAPVRQDLLLAKTLLRFLEDANVDGTAKSFCVKEKHGENYKKLTHTHTYIGTTTTNFGCTSDIDAWQTYTHTHTQTDRLPH